MAHTNLIHLECQHCERSVVKSIACMCTNQPMRVTEIDELDTKNRKLGVMIYRLLNKVDRVTKRHKAGVAQLDGDLEQLSIRQSQIEAEMGKLEK